MRTRQYAQVGDALWVLVEARLQRLLGVLSDGELSVLVSRDLTDAELRVLLRRLAAMRDEGP